MTKQCNYSLVQKRSQNSENTRLNNNWAFTRLILWQSVSVPYTKTKQQQQQNASLCIYDNYT